MRASGGGHHERLGPAVGVITRNKGGARVLSQGCCIGLKLRLCTCASGPCCRFRTKRHLESSKAISGPLRGSWRTAFTGNRPVTGGFSQGRRRWRLLQEGEMTATVQHPATCHVCNAHVFVQFVDSVTGFKLITLIRPVPPARDCEVCGDVTCGTCPAFECPHSSSSE